MGTLLGHMGGTFDFYLPQGINDKYGGRLVSSDVVATHEYSFRFTIRPDEIPTAVKLLWGSSQSAGVSISFDVTGSYTPMTISSSYTANTSDIRIQHVSSGTNNAMTEDLTSLFPTLASGDFAGVIIARNSHTWRPLGLKVEY